MRLKKYLAKLFVIISTFFIVLSPIVLIEEAGHNCTHEDCQICEVIRVAENNIKHTIKTNSGAHVVLFIATSFVIVSCLIALCEYKDLRTLVSNKIKLSN